MAIRKDFGGNRREEFLSAWQTAGRFLILMIFFLTSALAFSADAADSNTPTKPLETNNKFDVYIETNYENQPDLSKSATLRMIYAQSFWSKGQDPQLLPSKDRVIKYVAGKYKDYTGLLVIDIEHWSVWGSDEQAADSVKKFLTLLGWVKSAAPRAKVGYYSVVPVPGYWQAQVAQTHPSYKEWVRKNNRVQAMADAVDALFPSFYPVDAKQDAWVRWVTAQVNEAKRLGKGKPVYGVINPRYHSNAYDGLRYQLVPKDFIALQLTTLKKLGAKGVVIWGVDNSTKQWAESLPWWQATKEFLGT